MPVPTTTTALQTTTRESTQLPTTAGPTTTLLGPTEGQVPAAIKLSGLGRSQYAGTYLRTAFSFLGWPVWAKDDDASVWLCMGEDEQRWGLFVVRGESMSEKLLGMQGAADPTKVTRWDELDAQGRWRSSSRVVAQEARWVVVNKSLQVPVAIKVARLDKLRDLTGVYLLSNMRRNQQPIWVKDDDEHKWIAMSSTGLWGITSDAIIEKDRWFVQADTQGGADPTEVSDWSQSVTGNKWESAPDAAVQAMPPVVPPPPGLRPHEPKDLA